MNDRPSLALLLVLSIGFAYSGLATCRLYATLFKEPVVVGEDASINDLALPLDLQIDAMRGSVKRAGWEPDRDVVMVASVSSSPAEDIRRAHFVISYMLYPRQVWLAPWCDPQALLEQCSQSGASSSLAMALGTRGDANVIFVGGEPPLELGRARRVSDAVSLVQARR